MPVLVSKPMPGAVPITKSQAQGHVREIISSWQPPKEVFFLKYGWVAPALVTLLPGHEIVSRIQAIHRMPFSVSAKAIMGLTSCAMPALGASLVSDVVLLRSLLDPKPCSVCMEVRAVSTQLASGLLSSSLCALLGSYVLLHEKNALKFPFFGFDAAMWFGSMAKKNSRLLLLHACLQTVVISLVTWRQHAEWVYVNQELDNRSAQHK